MIFANATLSGRTRGTFHFDLDQLVLNALPLSDYSQNISAFECEPQSFVRHMRVNFSSGDARMAKEPLHKPYIHARFDK